MEKGLDQSMDIIRNVFLDLSRRDHYNQLQHIEQINTALTRVSQDHARALANILPTVQGSLLDFVQETVTTLRVQNQAAFDLATEVQGLWKDLGLGIYEMQQSIVQVTSLADQAVSALESSTQQSLHLRQTQLDASLSASYLVDTVDRLITLTHAEMEHINASAVLLTQSLLPPEHNADYWWKTALFRLMETVIHVEPAVLLYLSQLPLLKVLYPLVGILCYILRSTLSALMSVLVLFLSSRKYISKLAVSSSMFSLPQSQTSPRPMYSYQHAYHQRLLPDSNIRNTYLYSRSGILRISRIPDRLCNPVTR